ncbi:hypothetical protein BEP19_08290 [Ammoniphilus oxalaticus]|uniref:Signal transduction histidine kinase 5TM receptor LytS transmembrane region domain-containing protein n=1 Tax=Ammoniphilus oxalaticus TaxID=66863 RepID=A0A419SK39_9BACL|nr:LytS/YhcK type 5TM receptor domain-containing protein [Ammoniphilus oxalaticus]RKD24383.1 hypothetical protein BEP19_08290 [Ammoniphilus oxalaticus]
MTGLLPLLYNTVIVFVLFFILYGMIRYNPYPAIKREHWIGFTCSICIIFCMSFSFEVLPGYIYDLRTIPFVIGILYGGYLGGGLSALTLYLFRYHLGGAGNWNVWIVYSVILVLTYLIIPMYAEAKLNRKKWMATTLTLLTATLMLANTQFREGLPVNALFSMFTYLVLHGSVIGFIIHLIEQARVSNSIFTWANQSYEKVARNLSDRKRGRSRC